MLLILLMTDHTLCQFNNNLSCECKAELKKRVDERFGGRRRNHTTITAPIYGNAVTNTSATMTFNLNWDSSSADNSIIFDSANLRQFIDDEEPEPSEWDIPDEDERMGEIELAEDDE